MHVIRAEKRGRGFLQGTTCEYENTVPDRVSRHLEREASGTCAQS